MVSKNEIIKIFLYWSMFRFVETLPLNLDSNAHWFVSFLRLIASVWLLCDEEYNVDSSGWLLCDENAKDHHCLLDKDCFSREAHNLFERIFGEEFLEKEI